MHSPTNDIHWHIDYRKSIKNIRWYWEWWLATHLQKRIRGCEKQFLTCFGCLQLYVHFHANTSILWQHVSRKKHIVFFVLCLYSPPYGVKRNIIIFLSYFGLNHLDVNSNSKIKKKLFNIREYRNSMISKRGNLVWVNKQK